MVISLVFYFVCLCTPLILFSVSLSHHLSGPSVLLKNFFLKKQDFDLFISSTFFCFYLSLWFIFTISFHKLSFDLLCSSFFFLAFIVGILIHLFLFFFIYVTFEVLYYRWEHAKKTHEPTFGGSHCPKGTILTEKMTLMHYNTLRKKIHESIVIFIFLNKKKMDVG